MARVAICTAPPYPDWTLAVAHAFEDLGHQVVLTDHPNPDLAFDLAWIRIAEGQGSSDNSQAPGYWQRACQLEAAGVPLINSTRSLLVSHDKLIAQQQMEGAGLAPPSLWSVEGYPSEIKEPLICKPITGSRGRGITLVRDPGEAQGHQRAIGVPCLVQEFVPGATCIRAIATTEEVVAIYEKRPEPGQVVASISEGSKRVALDSLDPEVGDLAKRMVASVGSGISGVDILRDRSGQLFPLEVNASFAFDPEDRDVLRAFVRFLR
jgi:glutathione synthase/RimK-type ligase-like ATP-grasp enzyme